MRNTSQISETALKRLAIIVLLGGGLCAHAFAQTSSSSLPPLPSIPSVPAVPQAVLPEAVPQASIPPINGLPSENPNEVAALAGSNTGNPDQKTPTKEELINPLADLPAPSPESGEVASATALPPLTPPTQTASTPAAPEPSALPGLPLPTAELPPIPTASPVPNFPMTEAPTALPEIRVTRDPPTPKTWHTTLEQQVFPPKTNFNYRRVNLPGTIYRVQYDRENRHLPQRVTREDYEGLLFQSVAKNDVEAARALLNAGANLNATNAYGETPLMFAERAGASDVAALLAARGAR